MGKDGVEYWFELYGVVVYIEVFDLEWNDIVVFGEIEFVEIGGYV